MAQRDENTNRDLNKTYIDVLSFYNKHFPTDKKTYAIRVPFVGLVLSFLTFHFVTYVRSWNFLYGELMPWAYVLLSFGCAWQLFWGFNIGDRKQYTPWIVLKAVEIVWTIWHLLRILFIDYYGLNIFFGGLGICVLNIVVFYIVTMRSCRIYKRSSSSPEGATNKTDNNTYDISPEV